MNQLLFPLPAQHWGEAIHALTAWALAQGMSGQLTILAADGSSPGQAAIPRDQMPAGFAFTTIKFRPAAPGIRTAARAGVSGRAPGRPGRGD